MKIDLKILGMVAAAALAAGCGTGRGADDGWQTCTDKDGRVVDERQCQPAQPGYMPGLYRWYYYPFGGRPYPIGYGIPSGGHFVEAPYAGVRTFSSGIPTSGVRPPVVIHGGFGSSMHEAFGS